MQPVVLGDLSSDAHCDRTLPNVMPRERFYWRDLGGSLAVVDLLAFEFTILNKTAAFVWLSLLDESWQFEDLAGALSNSYSVSKACAENDLHALLDKWSSLDWLETSEVGEIRIPSKTTATPPAPYRPLTAAALRSRTSEATPEWSKSIDFIGNSVRVEFHCEQPLIDSDMSIRAKAFLNGLPHSDEAAGDPIECFITAAGVYLRHGDVCLKAEDVSDGLSRLVLWCFYSAYGRDNFLGTFHAAALGSDKGAILMPGASGVGKSTLTAYLARKNWAYGGDDIVGLSKPVGPEREHLVLPFCSAISVKEGSLDVLKPYYSGLEALPKVSYDTKIARFPSVPRADQMTSGQKRRVIRAIVFPAFDKTARTQLIRLSTEDALLALVGVGFRTGEVMNRTLLEPLFQFLQKTPKYRLTFSSLEEAQDILEELL